MRDAFIRHKYSQMDKEISIDGPNDLRLSVDFDDVDHESVEAVLDEMVDALNTWWENR